MPPHRRRVRYGAIALAVLAVPALLGQLAGRPAALRETPLKWGVYQILWSRDYGEQLDTEFSAFASKPDYVMFFRDLGRPYPKVPVDCITRHGATTLVSLELCLWHGRRTGSYLPAINAGEYDAFFRRWVADAKADGRRVLLRFGFEFNGDWFSWSLDPQGYISAWRRARDIFDAVGAGNVEWVWTPNVVSCPDRPDNRIQLYYPGDDYVDVIGVDGYNFGDGHDKWHTWQSFDDVFADALAELRTRYPNKPIVITEFGCAPGKPGQREKWIREAHESLRRRPSVRGAIWFNYDKRRENEPNWRIDVTAASLRAFNETFAAKKEPARTVPRSGDD